MPAEARFARCWSDINQHAVVLPPDVSPPDGFMSGCKRRTGSPRG
tara:strand:- start:281 stop:415 length:135 start_codon:yes stop_codon:yes gene_type:complete